MLFTACGQARSQWRDRASFCCRNQRRSGVPPLAGLQWRDCGNFLPWRSTLSSQLFTTLDAFPRLRVALLPTPLHELQRLRGQLGAHCPRLLIKRDDLTALALGGNKARKLEYLLADARRQGADTVITCGA